jgi:DNA-binding MarR family transcriptional regulator
MLLARCETRTIRERGPAFGFMRVREGALSSLLLVRKWQRRSSRNGRGRAAHSAALSEAAFADTPLTPAAAGVPDVIAANRGASIAEMARQLPTSAQGVRRLVSKLEAMGYLERLGDRGRSRPVCDQER